MTAHGILLCYEKREKHSVTVNNVTLTKAYNKKAHEDSIKQVLSFLSN